MTDSDIAANFYTKVVRKVDDRAVLNVRAFTNFDCVNVAS